jgi:NADH dehydrogenase [ubiquinone] 1 alpha subcomplex assembly factor 6
MNAEVASIKDSVRSNHLTGKIRLQWWRERIYALYESPSSGDEASRETLLLRELARAVQQHGLTRRWFERLLDARDQDLDVEQPRSLAELESYADKTAASLLYLTLECLGVRDTAADRAAHHAGMAIGLATLLRGTPFHALRQQVYLPEELMHQVSRR